MPGLKLQYLLATGMQLLLNNKDAWKVKYSVKTQVFKVYISLFSDFFFQSIIISCLTSVKGF